MLSVFPVVEAVCEYGDGLQLKGAVSTEPAFEKITDIQRLYVLLCGHTTFVPLTLACTMTIVDKITIFCNDVNKKALPFSGNKYFMLHVKKK